MKKRECEACGKYFEVRASAARAPHFACLTCSEKANELALKLDITFHEAILALRGAQ